MTLQTSDIVPGFTEAATLLAQQAQHAGVNVTIKKEPSNAYFDTSLLYTKMTFAQSYWTTGSLAAFYSQALESSAVWNETHFKFASFDSLVRKATGAKTVGTGTYYVSEAPAPTNYTTTLACATAARTYTSSGGSWRPTASPTATRRPSSCRRSSTSRTQCRCSSTSVHCW